MVTPPKRRRILELSGQEERRPCNGRDNRVAARREGTALRAADRVEIIETLSRYHHLIDSRELDALPMVFTHDAECGYSPRPGRRS